MRTATAILPLSHSPALPLCPSAAPSSPRWHLPVIAVIVGLIFFVTEHDLSISLVDAFTQTADEMEVAAEGGNFVRRLAFPALALLGLVLLITTVRQPVRINPLLALP